MNKLEYKLKHMKPDTTIKSVHHLKHVLKSEERANNSRKQASLMSKLVSAIRSKLS